MTAPAECRWYRCDRPEPAVFQIRFEQCPAEAGGFWPVRILFEQPLELPALQGVAVRLEGKGPAWMYAHAAAMAAAAGGASLQARSLTPGNSDDTSGCRREIKPAPSEAAWLIEVHLPPQSLSEAAIERWIEPLIEQLRQRSPRQVCLSGKAPMTVYAPLAWEAVQAGCPMIYCLTPTAGCVRVFARSDGGDAAELGECLPPQWLESLVTRPRRSVFVGIVGDPNSGKSVFAHTFYQALTEKYRSTDMRLWLYDTDGQAPTPPWYMALVQAGMVDRAKEYRDALKQGRNWTEPMQRHIAATLRRLRQFFEVVVVDLPGGDFQRMPPQRIPPGRETFFEQTDVLILLARASAATEQAWRQELRPFGLEPRLRVVLETVDPRQVPQPSLELRREPDGLWRGRITGLDRSQSPGALLAACRAGIDDLWQDLGRDLVHSS